MFSNKDISIRHALLFSGCKRTRRYIAAFASRNPHLFSSSLIHKAFSQEHDDSTRSWLAIALGRLGYINAKKDILSWAGDFEFADENRWWGIIGCNLLNNNQQGYYIDTLGKAASNDSLTAIYGLIDSYHLLVKNSETLSAIKKSLMSGDDLRVQWALTAISNTENFDGWDLVIDILENSDNPKTREWCAWSISSSCHKNTSKTLISYIEREDNPRVREWLYKALLKKGKGYESDFLAEAFSFENDFMVKEGIVQTLLYNKSDSSKTTLRKWVSDLIQNKGVIQTPEHEILASQIFKIYNSIPINTEEIDGLMKLAENGSWQLRVSICGIIREQLRNSNLSLIIRSGVYSKIGNMLEQESIILDDILKWDEMVEAYMPTILSEEVIQYHNGLNVPGADITQRATIIYEGDSRNIRISQSIQNVSCNGDLRQSVKFKN